MEKIIFTTVPELEEIVYSGIKKALSEAKGSHSKDEAPFLNLNETSKLLNLAPQTIYGLTSNREIPFFKRGKKLYFRESDLVTWLEKGRKQTLDELKSGSPGISFKKKGGSNE